MCWFLRTYLSKPIDIDIIDIDIIDIHFDPRANVCSHCQLQDFAHKWLKIIFYFPLNSGASEVVYNFFITTDANDQEWNTLTS